MPIFTLSHPSRLKARVSESGWWSSGRLVSQLLSLLCLAGTLWFFSPYSAIHTLDIKGTRHLSPEAVAAASGLLGRSPLSVDVAAVARTMVSQLPLQKAAVRVYLDGTAEISVEELPPALVWTVDGKSYLLSADGRLLGPGTRPGLPTVEASDLDPTVAGLVPPRLTAEIVHISSSFPEVTGATIAVISYSEAMGISVQTEAGWQVRFGTGDIDRKLAILRAMLGQHRDWTLLDLRFGDRPFFR